MTNSNENYSQQDVDNDDMMADKQEESTHSVQHEIDDYEYIPSKMYVEEPPNQHSITHSKKEKKKDKQEVVIPLVERGVAAQKPETEDQENCCITRRCVVISIIVLLLVLAAASCATYLAVSFGSKGKCAMTTIER